MRCPLRARVRGPACRGGGRERPIRRQGADGGDPLVCTVVRGVRPSLPDREPAGACGQRRQPVPPRTAVAQLLAPLRTVRGLRMTAGPGAGAISDASGSCCRRYGPTGTRTRTAPGCATRRRTPARPGRRAATTPTSTWTPNRSWRGGRGVLRQPAQRVGGPPSFTAPSRWRQGCAVGPPRTRLRFSERRACTGSRSAVRGPSSRAFRRAPGLGRSRPGRRWSHRSRRPPR